LPRRPGQAGTLNAPRRSSSRRFVIYLNELSRPSLLLAQSLSDWFPDQDEAVGQITVVTISLMLRCSSESSVMGLLIATSQAT
jgi:hypothetical protein